MKTKGGKKGKEGKRETEGSGSEGRMERIENKERDHVQKFKIFCLQHNSWGLHFSKSVALEIPHIAVQKCSPADNQ